jgi:peptidoglycan/LPS O-acetylase OafA/YrhL
MADIGGWEYALHFTSNLLLLPGIFPLPIAQIVAWTLSYDLAFYSLAAAALACGRARTAGWLKMFGFACWSLPVGWLLWQHPMSWFFAVGVACWWYFPMKTGADCVSHPRSLWGIFALSGAVMTFQNHFAACLLCSTLAFLTVLGKRGMLARLAQTRMLQYLGTVSYSFYLWHSMVLFPMKRLFGREGGLIPHELTNIVVFAAVSLAGSLAAAHVSYLITEQRVWWKRSTKAIPATIAAQQRVPAPHKAPATVVQ